MTSGASGHLLAGAMVAAYVPAVPRIAYLPVASPKLRPSPPSGPDWLHEIKFDGWRAQLHKHGDEVVVFSRNGHDFTHRFPEIRDSIRWLPVESAIIDAEVTVCNRNGVPDFRALMAGPQHGLCAWCFDLMQIVGKDLRWRPLLERRIYLRHLLPKADDDFLRYSEEFEDAERLLDTAARRVSKASFQSSPTNPIAQARIQAGSLPATAATDSSDSPRISEGPPAKASPEFVGTKEASRRAAVSERTMPEWCILYGLGHKIGGRWRVSPVDLDRFLSSRPTCM